jgi:4-hydroxybenzoate polyprenyltransferase
MRTIKAYLQLMRPANLLTAIADILGGIALTGFFTNIYIDYYDLLPVIFLCVSTIGLYGGGVVMNDVFDAKLDKLERPERPIPSGRAGKTGATLLAMFLLTAGVICAGMFGTISALLAGTIVVFALLYDKYAKAHSFWGPLVMGCCRGLNLLLGMSIIGYHLFPVAYIAAIPVLYIFSVTRISRGEVHGGNKRHLIISLLLYSLVIAVVMLIAFIYGHFMIAITGIILFALMILPPLINAIRRPVAELIGKAVKAGVLGIILLDTSWALVRGNIWVAVCILFLLPLSMLLAKIFAVT